MRVAGAPLVRYALVRRAEPRLHAPRALRKLGHHKAVEACGAQDDDGQRGRRLREARLDHGRQHARAIDEEERDLREDPDDHDDLPVRWGQRAQRRRWLCFSEAGGVDGRAAFQLVEISALEDSQASKLCYTLGVFRPRVKVPRTSPSLVPFLTLDLGLWQRRHRPRSLENA